MNNYKTLEGIFKSLCDSTKLSIQTKNEKLEINGRNSQYVSHRVAYLESVGHNVPCTVIISNDSYQILVNGGGQEFKGDVEYMPLPSYMIRKFYEFPLEVPSWLKGDGLVNVHYVDRFIGFDEDGNPQFSRYGKITYQDKIVLEEGTPPEPQEIDYDEE